MSETLHNEVSRLSDVMKKPSLVALEYALRHPETWPEKFVWNYGCADSCAIGLIELLWPEMKRINYSKEETETTIARTFAMSHREVRRVFYEIAPLKYVKTGWFTKEQEFDFSAITADDVADGIKKYLDNRA